MAENPEESDDSQTRAARGAARSAPGIEVGQDVLDDADLRRLIEAWPNLPDALRRWIVAMIDATGHRD